MDIGKVFPGATIGKRELRSLILSYRRYGKLKDTEKKLFQEIILSKNEYLDQPYLNQSVWSLALYIKFKLGKPLSLKHFKIAKTWVDTGDFNKLLSKFYITNPNYKVTNLKAIYKEFVFQGFVDMSTYTYKDLVDKKTKTRYDYIMSNIDILGVRFIYPKRLSSNYKILYKRGKRNPQVASGQDYFNRFGIPGYTYYRYANY